MGWLYTARLAIEGAREHIASIEDDHKIHCRRRSTGIALPSPKGAAGVGPGVGGLGTLQRRNSAGFTVATPRNWDGAPATVGARDRLMLEVDTWGLIFDSVSFLSECSSGRLTRVERL